MANYKITQKLNLNNKPTSISFDLNGDDADVTAFTALLEGGYEVKKVDDALSSLTGVDTLVTSTNPVTLVGLSGPQNQFIGIRPYSGAIHFKNTVSVDDIAAVCKTMKPFALLPTETPTRVSVKRYEVA
jgi:hypothetical protein